MRFKLKAVSFAMAAFTAAGGMCLSDLSAIVPFSVTARAETADSSQAVSIGIGEANKATVNIDDGEEVALTPSDVPQGQYYLMFKRTSSAAEHYLPVTVFADESYVYPVYNSYKNAFIALVYVKQDSEIILTGNGSETLSGEVYLELPFIGESTGYSVNNLLLGKGLSGVLQLADVDEGHYTVALNTYEELSEYEKFYFRLGSAAIEEMEYNANTDTFYIETEITSSVETIEVVTNNEAAVAVNVHMSASPQVDNSLPVDESQAFTQYETLSFVYRQTKTGYYTVSSHSEPAKAEFSVTFKTTSADPFGEMIADESYPVYMLEGKNYYFEITYFGVEGYSYENTPETVNAYFSVNEWAKPGLSVKEEFYVPVTSAKDTKTVPLKLTGQAGTVYKICFNGVPFEAERIYVNYAETVIILEAGSDFTGLITVEKDCDTVYFTSDNSEFISAISLAYIPPEYDSELKTDTITKVTLRAYENLDYFIYELPAGEYKISIIEGNGSVSVTDFDGTVIIAEGESSGHIKTETDKTLNLSFTNGGDSNVTFSVLISEKSETELSVGNKSQLTLGGNASVNCEILLDINIYTITLEYQPGSMIYVYLDGQLFIRAGATYSEFFINVSGSHILTFENGSDNEAAFSVIINLY